MPDQSATSARSFGSTTEHLVFRHDLRVTIHPGGQEYIVYDPVQEKYFRLGRSEYVLCCLLDGTRSGQEAVDRANVLTGDVTFDSVRFNELVERLNYLQLLTGADQQTRHARLEQAELQNKTKRLSRLNLMVVRLPIFDPHNLFSRLTPLLNKIPGRLLFFGWMSLVILGLIILVGRWQEFVTQAEVTLSPNNVLLLYGIWFLLKIVHETAHVLACYRFGGKVHEAGVVFILFFPLTYVDGTSSWGFTDRLQRLHAAAAGLYCELACAALALLLWASSPQSLTGSVAHKVVVVAGISSLVFNGNPLMRFDGYYILSDILGIPNLYSRGREFLMSFWKRLFFGIQGYRSNYSGWREIAIRIYGMLAWLWRIAIFITLVGISTRMLHGFGIAIAVSAIIFWFGVPLWRFVKMVWSLAGNRQSCIRRFTVVTVTLLVICTGALQLVSWRQQVIAPGIVQYKNQKTVFAESSGFITQLYTASGNWVAEGEQLLQLENRELQAHLKSLQLLLKQRLTESRVLFSQGNVAGRQAVAWEIDSLRQEIGSRADEISGLAVVAPVAGRVVTSKLEQRKGSFISKGQELLTLVINESKELHVSVAEQDIEGFQGKLGQSVEVDLRLLGLERIPGVVAHLSPRASVDIDYPALAATAGGPISVRIRSRTDDEVRIENNQPSYEFFAPRFQVVVDVPEDIAGKLYVGQVCAVYAEGGDTRLWEVMRDLLKGLFFGRDPKQLSAGR